MYEQKRTPCPDCGCQPGHVHGPTTSTYLVRQWFADTEIVRLDDLSGEHSSFDEAQARAIDYLQDLINLCECRLAEIEAAGSWEEYSGASCDGEEGRGGDPRPSDPA